METDTFSNYNSSVQLPAGDNILDNQQPRQVIDQKNSGSPHSAAADVSRLSLFPKIEDRANSGRMSRRRSVLESTMMEQSDKDKLISPSHHSMTSILSGHINDFVKIIKTVTEVEDGLTENVLEINPMQNFIAHANKFNDPKYQTPDYKSYSGPTKGLKENLDFAVDFIQSESGKSTCVMQKFYNDKIMKIVDDRRQKLQNIYLVKNGITAARKNALDAEQKRNEEALKGFSLKLENPILPKVPLQLDNIPFKACNLVTDSPVDIGTDDNPKILMEKIKKIDISRTNSRIKKGWWVDASMKIIDIEKQGVLEMDADSKKSANGALEAQNQVSVSSSLYFSAEELKILRRMNSRKTYLKNPRFNGYLALPEIKNSLDSLKESDSYSNLHDNLGIYAEPRVVYFTDYEVGKEFTQQLRIRNKTQNSHRFRLEPISPNQYSNNFTYTLAKSPIKNNGLVAPGMTCTYNITFLPNSLADLTFSLNVMTEMGYSFKVPIFAQRKAPVLTLPKELHCGPCREGFIAHRKWEFQNTGGPGRFLIIKNSENVDPYSMIESMEGDLNTDEEVVFQAGPFEIYPAYFTLEALEKKVLHVTYFAKEIEFANKFEEIFERQDQITVQIGCDNGKILEMPIIAVAQTCRLEISKFDPRNKPIYFGKIENESSRFVVDFGGQNSYAVTSSLIVVKNKTQLKLPFKWIAYDNPGNLGKDIDYNTVVKSESIQVNPSEGWISPDSETVFEVTFSPDKVKKYDVFTNLMICNDHQKCQNNKVAHEEPSLVLRCLGEGFEYHLDASPPLLQLSGVIYALEMFYTEIRLRNKSVSKIAFDWFLENLDSSVVDIEMSQTSGTITENETILIGVHIFAKFPLRLDGNLVCVTGHGVGPKIIIPIQGDVQLRASTICFNEDLIDFGLLALGNAGLRKINLVNTSNFSISWNLMGNNREKESNENSNFFLKSEPNSGTLEPREKQEIDVLYVPTWQQSFRGILECRISGIWTSGQEPQMVTPSYMASAIQIKAEVQTPQLHVLNPKNYVTSFIGVSFDWTLILQNITMIPTKYRWRSHDFTNVRIVFPDDGGELGGKETREITLKMTYLSLGSFPDVSLFLEVVDMISDAGLVRIQIDAIICNIDVSFKIAGNKGLQSIPYTTRPTIGDAPQMPHLSSATNDFRFDFGSDCPIFGTRMRSLIIRNMSSVTTSYKIWFENYNATVYHDEDSGQIRDNNLSISSIESQLLKSTPRSKLGFRSESGQSYIDNINKIRNIVQQMHKLLKNGRGAAFNPAPKEGIIEPWAELKIDIISYNNLVGVYEDLLHVEVGDSIHETMAVSMNVVGTAVKFHGAQLVSNKKNIEGWIDRINFGSRIVNLNWKGSDGIRVKSISPTTNSSSSHSNFSESFSKVINIENQSPRSVILNWKVYIQYKASTEQIGPCATVKSASIIHEENLVKENDIGIFEIVPKSMTISGFKTIPLKVIFRSALVGTYNALAIAEVGYLERGGDIRYAPVKPNTKLFEKSLARIHIQSKVIEPRLTLEEMEYIRIKRKINVQNPNDQEDYKTVNAFLKNNSDAICLFKIETLPKDIFAIKSSSKFITSTSNNEHLFQLKPTEQMLIAVSFTPKTAIDKNVHKILERSSDTEPPLKGELKITFSNGMIQSFPIEVCGRVVRSMEKIAPLSLGETWDNIGILVEAPNPRMATKVFLTIDLTNQVLEEALSDSTVGVIVAYHPPLFRSFKRLTLSDEKSKIALQCAAAGVSIYSPHTSLDSAVGGINDWLAKGLGPGQTCPITPLSSPPEGQDGCGIGRLHVLHNPMSVNNLADLIKIYLCLKSVRIARSASCPELIKDIGICAGSGSSVLKGVKADLYLTGEMSHHELLEANANGATVVLVEHSNSERGYLSQVLMPRLQSLLRVDQGLDQANDIEIEVICSGLDKDPIEYY